MTGLMAMAFQGFTGIKLANPSPEVEQPAKTTTDTTPLVDNP